jgi:hypothetical protein
MPKNVLIPAPYGGGLTPPVAEQSIRFDRTRATNLNGYAPADALGSDLFEVSCWIKITGDNGLTRVLWEAFIDANNFTHLALVGAGNNERLRFEAQIGGAIRAQFTTGGIIRDTSAWYHISVQFSRTTGTPSTTPSAPSLPPSTMSVVMRGRAISPTTSSARTTPTRRASAV